MYKNKSNNKGKQRNGKPLKRDINKVTKPNGKKVDDKDNFQDEAEISEFKKGFKAGENVRKGIGKFPTNRFRHNENDPQWYFKDSNILNDVASFSFSSPLGNRIPFDKIYSMPADTASNKYGVSNWMASIPGVLALTIAPIPGISKDAQSPVNLAATNVYSFVRYKNSGAANYDAPDLMMYLLAMDSIYSCWNWMKRLYGMASIYSQTNKYAPRAWVRANGVDFEDLISNLAQFRAYLNIKAGEISAFCVPATMTYNIRHSWLFSNVYTDGDTSKAQQYIYVPAYFYKYDELTSQRGGQLVPMGIMWKEQLQVERTLLKVEDLMTLLNTLLEAVNYSEDIGIMSGDILKAYGPSGLFKLSTFEPDYAVEPTYSKEVLSQIENAVSPSIFRPENGYRCDLQLSDFTVTQDPDTNYIEFSPSCTPALNQIEAQFINFHWDNPTPEEVMVATRLKTTAEYINSRMYILSTGSEMMLNYTIWSFVQTNAVYDHLNSQAVLKLKPYDISYRLYFDLASEDDTHTEEMLWAIGALSAFDWHPWTSILVDTVSSGIRYERYFGNLVDFDKYTIVSNEDISAMNTLALLTEFNVPN